MPTSTRTSAFIKFCVEGVGAFPVDMLRYDCAWPLRGVDTVMITKSIENTTTQRYSVWLKTSGRVDVRPTLIRWKSFGWDVTTVEKATA